jgi:hypothetical protein
LVVDDEVIWEASLWHLLAINNNVGVPSPKFFGLGFFSILNEVEFETTSTLLFIKLCIAYFVIPWQIPLTCKGSLFVTMKFMALHHLIKTFAKYF